MKTYIQIGLDEYRVEFDYTYTPGCPEQGPSYASGGQPAEPAEWEVKGKVQLFAERTIYETRPGEPGLHSVVIDIELEVPLWLDEAISEYIHEDARGTIGPAIEEEQGERDDH